MAVELHPHQEKAVEEMHNGCVLTGGVGSGKTIVALEYYIKNETPRDVFVITTAKKREELDWQKWGAQYAIGASQDSTAHGVMVVDSWNNIGNYKDVHDAFFIFDEQRLVGNGAWVKAFLKLAQNNRWVLLSATPGDVWLDYVPLFIANGFYKNRSEFFRRHVVMDPYVKFPKIARYLETAHLERLRREVIVTMPFKRHTVRHVKTVKVAYDKEKYETVFKKRWHFLEDRPIENVSEMFSLGRRVLNTDVTRLGAVLELFEKHPKLIIFYNHNPELEMLRILVRTLGVEYGELNGQNHDPVPDGERWIYLVQYTAGAEAWNCTRTDAMIFWSQTYSYKILEQSMGRIDRLNTPFTDLHYYILRSDAPLDAAIHKCLATKRVFNEKGFWEKLV